MFRQRANKSPPEWRGTSYWNHSQSPHSSPPPESRTEPRDLLTVIARPKSVNYHSFGCVLLCYNYNPINNRLVNLLPFHGWREYLTPNGPLLQRGRTDGRDGGAAWTIICTRGRRWCPLEVLRRMRVRPTNKHLVCCRKVFCCVVGHKNIIIDWDYGFISHRAVRDDNHLYGHWLISLLWLLSLWRWPSSCGAGRLQGRSSFKDDRYGSRFPGRKRSSNLS